MIDIEKLDEKLDQSEEEKYNLEERTRLAEKEEKKQKTENQAHRETIEKLNKQMEELKCEGNCTLQSEVTELDSICDTDASNNNKKEMGKLRRDAKKWEYCTYISTFPIAR